MRDAAPIPLRPIRGRWASLLDRAGLRPHPPRTARGEGLKHLVFVWKFSVDGQPQAIGAVLERNNLGILLKTHSGVEWMSKYDPSPFAVTGPDQIATLARYYEEAGVPFHAWTVVKGVDVAREARMAAEVLEAGARSLVVDLEPHDRFWQGTAADAARYGRDLRRLAPDGRVVLSVDPRPWAMAQVPMAEFAAFADEIAPQQYWRSFDTPTDRERFTRAGFPVPPRGVTPEFLNDVSAKTLGGYGLPLSPTGQGAANDVGAWRRFVDHAYGLGACAVSCWRYGVTGRAVFRFLRRTPPRAPSPGASRRSAPDRRAEDSPRG